MYLRWSACKCALKRMAQVHGACSVTQHAMSMLMLRLGKGRWQLSVCGGAGEHT